MTTGPRLARRALLVVVLLLALGAGAMQVTEFGVCSVQDAAPDCDPYASRMKMHAASGMLLIMSLFFARALATQSTPEKDSP